MEEQVPRSIDAIRARIAQLTERERRLLAIMGVASIVFVALFGNLLIGNALDGLREGNDERRQALNALIHERESYLQEVERARALEEQLEGNQLRLSSFIEAQASAAGVPRPREFRDHSQPVGQTGITSHETTVSFPSMSFEQLMDLLNTFDSSDELVFVQSLRVAPARRGDHGLDADITIATYRRTGEP